MQGSYDIWLVLLSVGIAIMGAYAGLDMAARVAMSRNDTLQRLWLLGGALAMGSGIWTMHCIGMLALNLPIPFAYNIPLALLALVLAVLISGLSLFLVSGGVLPWPVLLPSGIIMGLGVSSVHILTAISMEIAPPLQHDPVLLAPAILLICLASLVAFWLTFSHPTESSLSALWKKAGSAILLGLVLANLHYSSSGPEHFAPATISLASNANDSADLLAMIVTVFTGLIFTTTVLLGMLDARLAQLAEKRVREMTQELRHSEERFRTMTERMRDIFTILGPDGRAQYVSPAILEVLGYEPGKLLGKSLFDLLHPQDLEAAQYQFGLVVKGEEMARPIEFRMRHNDGSWRMLEAFARNELANTAVAGIVVHSRDITEHKQSQQLIWNLAHHDALTGLPNRSLLKDRLGQAIHQAHREEHKLAVLFLDLDHFKHINDSLDHHVGDVLLQTAAHRIELCLREGDTVARLGGDEFVVLLPVFQTDSDVILVADKILEALNRPFEIDNHQLHIGVSIGISQYPRDGQEPGALMRMADAAMYHAKANGRNNAQFFNEQIDSVARERLQVENGLRQALQQQELRLYFQPLVNLESGRIVGMEALIRWEHPQRGLLSPANFVDIAEDSGLIMQIGEWILSEACRQTKALLDRGYVLQVAINLSARQIESGMLHQTVLNALKTTGLPAKHLKLEITEGSMISSIEETSHLLERLRNLGIQIAIDDFGTGYSSLSYLKRFPIDTLKIDQSFVRDIGIDSDDEAIVTAIVAVAHSLKMSVIAEGIESERQIDFLRRLGCEMGQGYYFSRPVEAGQFSELLAAGQLGHKRQG